MESTTPWRSDCGDRATLVGITGMILATTFLVYSPAEIPIVDDWTYAWSVEHFLHTGELRMLEWSAHYPLSQVLWGALFSQLFGFSFVVLRLSTLVLAWAGLLAFFLTLREVGIGPFPAGLATLALWCNPVFFVLSHSFMTDVPFVSAMNAAILFYVRWVNRWRTWDLCLGSVLTMLAFLNRQLGAALALIPLGYLLLARWHGRERWALPWSQLICLLMPFLGIGLSVLVDQSRARGDPRLHPEGAEPALAPGHFGVEVCPGTVAPPPEPRAGALAAGLDCLRPPVKACPDLGVRGDGGAQWPLPLAGGRAA